MFAETTPEQLLVVAHCGLQSAIRVGHHVVAALDELTHGASRVWLEASHIPMPKYSVQKALDSLRYDWGPGPATYHSAGTLHHDASEALSGIVRATPLTFEALATGASQAPPDDNDEGPWETVPAVLDPLRAAQEVERQAIILSAEPPAQAIGR